MGLNAEEINERWPDDLQASQQDLEGWRGNGGESLGDLRNRVLEVRDELLAQHQGETVAIVAHMMPIKALLAEALDLRLEQWPDIQLPTGSISLVDYSNGAGIVSWQAKKPTRVDTGP
jgi:broad specificity phosphatase PhoE